MKTTKAEGFIVHVLETGYDGTWTRDDIVDLIALFQNVVKEVIDETKKENKNV